jgi:DNA-binding LacI/PurR family transcriptional regulator
VSDSRLDAFREAVRKKGLYAGEELISTSDFNDEDMFSAVKRLLQSEERPEALLAGSPRFGLTSVKCALSLSIKVPDELKIIALGTSNFFNLTHPSLSAVELPLYDMGYRAAEMLMDRMRGIEVQKSVVLPSELVIRDSC